MTGAVKASDGRWGVAGVLMMQWPAPAPDHLISRLSAPDVSGPGIIGSFSQSRWD